MKIALGDQGANVNSPIDTFVERATCFVPVDAATFDRLRTLAACANQSLEATALAMINRGVGDALSEMTERE